MPALVFKYENAYIEPLITHTVELKVFEITPNNGRESTIPIDPRMDPRIDCMSNLGTHGGLQTATLHYDTSTV